MSFHSKFNISTKTQKNFDPQKYSGEWYEIAKYKLIWEKDCDRAKAIYKWDSVKNLLLIENQCFDKNGNLIRSRFGEARIPDMNDKSKLILKFTDGLPSQGESPYWVHWTNYDYSIVGGPSGQYLWLLSRNKYIKLEEIDNLLNIIKSFGYDTNRLMANPKTVI